MTMPTSSLAFAVGAGTLLLAAAVSDMRRFTIPNWICLALVVLYAVRGGAGAAAGTALAPMLVPVPFALAILVAGAFVFQRGWLGGGDVKLLAAASLWIPAERLLDFLTLVALLGGVLATVVLIAAWFLRPAVAGQAGGRPLASVRLPYGVAISGAGMLILFDIVNL